MLDYAQPLDPGGLVREQALSFLPPRALGCTALAAMWSLTVVGRVPREAERGVIDLGAWAREAGHLWPALLAWHHEGWWTPPIAHQELLGGRLAIDLSGCNPPPLTPGRWHILHDIDSDESDGKVDYNTGHVMIVHAISATTYRLVQSSRKYGYRDTQETQWPRKPGRLACVLTLPSFK